MPWDFALIVLLLGVFVPWRSLVRMRQLLRALARGFTPRSLGIALDAPLPALAIAVPLCGILAALQIYGLRHLARLPAEQQGYAGILARKLMPQNSVESLVFAALAATVAVCEEFLYRGFLLAALQPALGQVIIAVLASTLLFALGHLYQGARGLVSTFLLGLALCALRISTASLAPCVVIHFGVDLVAGLAAPRLLPPASVHLDSAAGASAASGEEKAG